MMDYDVERKIAELSLTEQESFFHIELDSTIAELQREKQELEQLIAQEGSSLEKEEPTRCTRFVSFALLVGNGSGRLYHQMLLLLSFTCSE
jgi:hypothetical protein